MRHHSPRWEQGVEAEVHWAGTEVPLKGLKQGFSMSALLPVAGESLDGAGDRAVPLECCPASPASALQMTLVIIARPLGTKRPLGEKKHWVRLGLPGVGPVPQDAPEPEMSPGSAGSGSGTCYHSPRAGDVTDPTRVGWQ